MDLLYPLLGRTLVLVAHPDDETVGCGVLLQRMREPIVVFATDGAPRSSFFWVSYGSRKSYATLRWSEAAQALRHAGVNNFQQLCEWNPIPDQELFLNLECAYKSLAGLIESELPTAILTSAYEGGHPDHDCCSFLAAVAGKQYGLPVWEVPFYQRAHGVFETQFFIDGHGFFVNPSRSEKACKQAMFDAYLSQTQVLRQFNADVEIVRPARNYDFSRPPHSGTLNYEAWDWPMRGGDLCRAFTRFSTHSPQFARKLKWETAA